MIEGDGLVGENVWILVKYKGKTISYWKQIQWYYKKI